MNVKVWEVSNRTQHSCLLVVRVSGIDLDPDIFVVWSPTGRDTVIPAHFDPTVEIHPDLVFLSVASAADLKLLGTAPSQASVLYRTNTVSFTLSSRADLQRVRALVLEDIRSNVRVQDLPDISQAVEVVLVNNQDIPDSDATLYFQDPPPEPSSSSSSSSSSST